MKGKVCGDFCEFTLDKGHFITGINMNEKEQLLQLIENVPDYKIGYALAFVRGLLACDDTEK